MAHPLLEIAGACIALWVTSLWYQHDPNWESFAAFCIAIAGLEAAVFHWGHFIGTKAVTLRLVIDNSSDCLPTSYQAWRDGVPRHRRFVRLQLYNDSAHVAANACVTLLHLSEQCPDGERAFEYPNPRFFRWNGEGGRHPYEKKTLQSGGPQYADVLFTELMDDSAVRVVLTDEPYTPVGLVTGKTYGFVVQTKADNSKAVTRRFYVTVGDGYNDIRIHTDTRFRVANALRSLSQKIAPT